MDLVAGEEGDVAAFPSPEALWAQTYAVANAWRERFAAVPFEDKGGTWQGRYYQETAIKRVLDAVGEGRDRVLLTLATGTGKTFCAFQLAWKLYQARWNLSDWRNPQAKADELGTRRPRILFLADRNILADQAYNAFFCIPGRCLGTHRPRGNSAQGRCPRTAACFSRSFRPL